MFGQGRLETRPVRALGQPARARPAPETPLVALDPARELERNTGASREQRQHGMRSGGRPQLDAAKRCERAEQVAALRLETGIGALVVARCAPKLGGQLRLACVSSSLASSAWTSERISRRNAMKRSPTGPSL